MHYYEPFEVQTTLYSHHIILVGNARRVNYPFFGGYHPDNVILFHSNESGLKLTLPMFMKNYFDYVFGESMYKSRSWMEVIGDRLWFFYTAEFSSGGTVKVEAAFGVQCVIFISLHNNGGRKKETTLVRLCGQCARTGRFFSLMTSLFFDPEISWEGKFMVDATEMHLDLWETWILARGEYVK